MVVEPCNRHIHTTAGILQLLRNNGFYVVRCGYVGGYVMLQLGKYLFKLAASVSLIGLLFLLNDLSPLE